MPALRCSLRLRQQHLHASNSWRISLALPHQRLPQPLAAATPLLSSQLQHQQRSAHALHFCQRSWRQRSYMAWQQQKHKAMRGHRLNAGLSANASWLNGLASIRVSGNRIRR